EMARIECDRGIDVVDDVADSHGRHAFPPAWASFGTVTERFGANELRMSPGPFPDHGVPRFAPGRGCVSDQGLHVTVAELPRDRRARDVRGIAADLDARHTDVHERRSRQSRSGLRRVASAG